MQPDGTEVIKTQTVCCRMYLLGMTCPSEPPQQRAAQLIKYKMDVELDHDQTRA